MPSIAYTLKRYKKSKTLRVHIKPTGEVVATAPHRLAKKYIDTFIEKKSIWIQEKIEHFLSIPQSSKKHEEQEYKIHKENARARVIEKVKEINNFYNFKINAITIRNQKTRWGSCSCKKNLNFNYKVVFLPPHLFEYVIVHEICHLQEMNHGPRFWNLVSEKLPEYRALHKELRTFKIRK